MVVGDSFHSIPSYTVSIPISVAIPTIDFILFPLS